MSIEIVDEKIRGASTMRELASFLIALPRKYPVGWAVAWTALLLGLCLAPSRILPDEHSISIKKYIPYGDLAVHFTLFAGFVVSWIRIGGSPLRWVAVPAIGLLLAFGTEYAQGFSFIHRDPSVLDALADVAGVVMGLVAWAILCRLSAVNTGAIDPR